MRNLQVVGLVTQLGKFRAEVTCIDLRRLWMHRFNEDLPQIIRVTPCGMRAQIIFATDPGQPAMQANGIETSQNQLRGSACTGTGTFDPQRPADEALSP